MSNHDDLTQFTIWIGTWNLNSRQISDAPANLKTWIAPDHHQPDIYVIGLQELPDLAVSTLFSAPDVDRLSLQYQENIEAVFTTLIPEGYSRLVGNEFGAMAVDVFVKDDKRMHIKEVATRAYGFGILGGLGQKGAVSVRFSVFGHSICIISCHLAANEGNKQTRDSQIDELWATLKYADAKGEPFSLSDHEHVILMGDLNYRMQAPSPVMLELLEKGQGKLDPTDIHLYDELSGSKDSGPFSKGFVEMPIEFPPTYKYTPLSDTLVFNDRVPSFTDRILFRPPGPSLRSSSVLRCILYDSARACQSSDHKPVMALLEWCIDHHDADVRHEEEVPECWPVDVGNRAAQAVIQGATAAVQYSLSSINHFIQG